ncbi:cytochrome c [Litoribacillus peritrichatus]|uniref:Cytochrome c domain-containing protein n=1 Tax=Litoribacillus peritrichatus TaxID=718191 RepID=A0ABP7MSM3_9GAMM
MFKSILNFGAYSIVILIAACSDQNDFPEVKDYEKNGRWYNHQQVTWGRSVYDKYCINCHNSKAVGTFKWKQPLEDGSYPPPPLNGTAHTWHHSLPVLLRTINDGGIHMGGKMPPFKDVLTDEEKLAVISYFQSFWSDEVYGRWSKRNSK